eukprot:jgi/Mesvir1/17468/Mv08744-RA.1
MESHPPGKSNPHALHASAPVSSKSQTKKVAREVVTMPDEPVETKHRVARGMGKRSHVRSGLEDIKRMQERGKRNDEDSDSDEEDEENPLAVAFGRNFEFIKRVFSPEAIFEPLPPALKHSLSRNFSFLTRIFTQFVDPNQAKAARESIPGLATGRKN